MAVYTAVIEGADEVLTLRQYVARGNTHADLARSVGVTRHAITKFSRRPNPSVAMLNGEAIATLELRVGPSETRINASMRA